MKKPKIRFYGFNDDWEQRKAKDLCSISTGKSNTQDRVDDGIYPFYVRSPIVERSNRYLFDEEAVLTVGDGVGTGKVFHYVNGKYDLHQRVYRMFDFSEEITAKYFYYYFSNHFYDRVMSMTAKTSVDSVRYEMIADMDISLPKIQEQSTISDYFDNLDNLITLHQRKCDEVKKMKKYMLQNMFPQDGEKVPKIRFGGFTDDWEQRKVFDVAEIIAGGTPKTSVLEYWNPKEVPWLSSGEVHKKYITYTDDKISKKGLDHSSAKIIKENSVLIALAGQGKTRGTVAINRIPLSTNQSIAAMIFNDNIVPEFIFSNLDNRYNELRRISSGDGSRGGLNKLLIGNIIIPYTDKLEQDKIGQFFSLLDHLITLHQCKQIARIKNVNNDEKQRKPIKKLIIFENSLFLVDDIRLLHRMILYITMNYILLRLNTVIIKGDDEYVRIRS